MTLYANTYPTEKWICLFMHEHRNSCYDWTAMCLLGDNSVYYSLEMRPLHIILNTSYDSAAQNKIAYSHYHLTGTLKTLDVIFIFKWVLHFTATWEESITMRSMLLYNEELPSLLFSISWLTCSQRAVWVKLINYIAITMTRANTVQLMQFPTMAESN